MKISKLAVIHEGAVVDPSAEVGDFAVVYAGARIAARCVIEGFTQVWGGIEFDQGVHVGAGVVFARPSVPGSDATVRVRVRQGARLGPGSVVEAGVEVGEGAVVSPGSWVAQNVPAWAIVAGSPARVTGYVESAAVPRHLLAKPMPGVGLDPVRVGVGDVTLHRLNLVRDPRGDLCAGEMPSQVPFTPKRYFLVFNVPTEKARGEHAHRTCHQFLTCVHGSCAVVVDDGVARSEIILDSPDLGVHLPAMTWGVQYKYSADAVLLVFASEAYDAADYIRDYSEFLDAVGRLAGTGA